MICECLYARLPENRHQLCPTLRLRDESVYICLRGSLLWEPVARPPKRPATRSLPGYGKWLFELRRAVLSSVRGLDDRLRSTFGESHSLNEKITPSVPPEREETKRREEAIKPRSLRGGWASVVRL